MPVFGCWHALLLPMRCWCSYSCLPAVLLLPAAACCTPAYYALKTCTHTPALATEEYLQLLTTVC